MKKTAIILMAGIVLGLSGCGMPDFDEAVDRQIEQESGIKNDDDYDNVTPWKRIPAEGVFTVDMAACEYVVDNERKYVLLRVPKPVLGDISIDEKNKKTLLYRDDGLFDKNQQYAADLDEKQTNDAKKKLEKKMRGNQEYYTKAEQSAKIVIKNMVEMLNYDIDDLKVEVEFME